MNFRFIFSIIALGVGISLQAQTLRQFTHERQAFYDEAYKIMNDVDRRETKAFMDAKFGPFWLNSQIYDDTQAEKIYAVADVILKKRLRPFPFYETYFTCLMSFPGSPQEGNGFDTWIDILLSLEKGSKKDLEDFLSMSLSLFSDNVFYESSSTLWKTDNPNWEFKYDGKEATIAIPNGNLICRAKGDSSVIYATSGEYYPKNQKFFGKDGKITWERAGLDPNETYAVIQKPYELNIRTTWFIIDSVQFYNSFFSYPLMGIVEDKILANITAEKATYPQFSSYAKRLSIDNIVDKVDYSGGFRMEGANLQGYGSEQEPAILTFKRDDIPQLISYARFYAIKPDRISSQDARVVIMLNNDSIVHPSLKFRFRNDKRELDLIRTDEGLSKSPYYNSYHQVDMYFESFRWNIDDPIIRMGNLPGSTETRAAFESANFFRMLRYTSIQGMDKINPLYGIQRYARQINSDYMDAQNLANSMGYRLEDYIPRLIDLANKGYVNYEISTGLVEVRQKLYDYIQAAAGNIDYDVIIFNSDVKGGTNAELNLINLDLSLKGVNQILLSDSQNVAIYPKNGEVNLRKNRNFNFGGVIKSGRFEFYGQEYAFDYDKFQIDLIAVDSCQLYVEDFDPKSKALRRVKNVIEGIQGTLQIDNPFNKSGLQDAFSEYPILTSAKNSYVYYDNRNIQGGVYERDKVYFELEPFVLDSLDKFDTDNVAFEGKFMSGGIFPELTEQLGIQKDYSLGFVRATPAEGLPLYGSKAVFKNDIVVNYNGIQGDGDLEYLTSVSSSNQFTFFPDSTRGITTSFVNHTTAGPPEVPEAHAAEVDLAYYPIDDKLIAGVMKSPISLFEEQAMATKGYVELNPNGLTGFGIVEFSGAELESNLITYNQNTFSSDTAEFRLLAMTDANMAFKTDNVNAFINFDERVGEFKSNGDETIVEFPVNQYLCYMDEFKWYMDDDNVEMQTSREMATDFVIDTELNMSRSNFFSTRPEQDSLNFMSPKAVYDLKSYTITASEIPWILVADARITPSDGTVVIHRRAKMDPLANATILTNYITQYHTIHDASVNILSRNDYVGSGEYIYVDENKQEKIIAINTIGVDSTLQSVGSGKITEADRFYLSPHFEYQGHVHLFANQKHLNFDGSTRIIHSCERLERNWMNFTASIDPMDVKIPVDSVLIDNRGNPVDIGMKLTKSPYEIYGTFLSASINDDDQPVLTSRGLLTFNKASQQYEVAAEDKLKQNKLPGNFVSLSTNSCDLTGQGKLMLSTEKDLGQFDLNTIGKLTYKPSDEKITIDASMTLFFPFNAQALEKMRIFLNGQPFKPIDFAKSNYEYGIRELMGLEASDKVISELSLSGTIRRLPDELNKTIFISDIKLTWDPVLESFVSTGNIGVASFGKDQFFREIPGKIAIEKKASGDIVHIYFEADEENWYYFTYKRGLMQAYSSDKEFNNLLLEEKEDKRKTAGKRKEDDYLYMLGSKSKHNIFLDQFMF